MFQRFRLPSLVVIVVLTASSMAQSPKATLHIQVDKPLHSVSPKLYGLMTEEINYSYDGGLYAEMVRNRTFEEHGWAGVAHWNLVHLGNAQANMTVDTADGPSEALPRSLRLISRRPTQKTKRACGTRASGAWRSTRTPTYKGSFYAKAGSAEVGPMRCPS